MKKDQNIPGIPKKRLDIAQLKELHTPSELERVILKFGKLLYNPPTGEIVLLMETDEKTIAHPLSEFEGAMASFVFLGCALNSHIKTIHQMYLALLDEIGSTLEFGVIEAKHGDVFYATLEFKDKRGKRYRTLSSFADAVMLTSLSGANLYILQKVVNEIEDFKDWTYFQEIVDQDQYDEED